MKSETEERAKMTWAKRLKQVFDLDIKVCESCGGAVKIIACIEDQTVTNQILTHLNLSYQQTQVSMPISRAPPILVQSISFIEYFSL